MHLKRSTWILLIILVLAVIAGIKFAPPYIRYMQFSYFLGNEANESYKVTNEEILRDINNKVEEMNLPIAPQNVVFLDQKPRGLEDNPYILLERGKDYFSISAEYQVTVHLIGKYETVLNFTPEIYSEISADKE